LRYEEILSRAFRIAWTRKYLWLLAILAGEATGGGGGFNTGVSPFGQPRAGTVTGGTATTFNTPDLSWVPGWIYDRIGIFIAVAAVLLVIGIVWFVVGCIATGGLIRAVADIDAGEDVRLGRAWSLGVGSFGRVLGFKLLIALLIVGPALVLIGGPVLLAVATQRWLLLVLLVPLVLLVAVWALAVSLVSAVGIRALVLDRLGVAGGIGAGVGLLRRRPGRVLAIFGILIGVGFLAGIGVGLVVTVVGLPFVGVGAAMFAAGNFTGLITVAVIGIVVVVAVSLVVGGAVGSYFSSVWTLAYRRFELAAGAPPAPSLPL
jgi:hypothetical protein